MAGTLFPVIEVPEITIPGQSVNRPYPSSVRFDFDKGDFVRDGACRMTPASGFDAYMQWCRKVCLTERDRFLSYSTDIGIEAESSLAQADRAAVESALERTITEALMVKAGTIVIMASRTLTGIESIVNEEAASGGAETENHEELRARIAEVYMSKGASFIGCDADYVRWAMEVETVGAAIVEPEWDGPGTVAVVVVDRTGFPADQTILDAVYEHIISPNDRLKRLAPIGATLTVKVPVILTVDVACRLTLEIDAAYSVVYESLRKNIMAYFLTASSAGVVRYAEIGSIIIQTEGVEDYEELRLNGTTANITFTYEQFPVLETLETGIVPESGGD